MIFKIIEMYRRYEEISAGSVSADSGYKCCHPSSVYGGIGMADVAQTFSDRCKERMMSNVSGKNP